MIQIADTLAVTSCHERAALTINGQAHTLDAPVGTSLFHVLRDVLGLTGTKIACNEGHCGACTVQVDGVPGSRASRSRTRSRAR